MHSDYPIHFDVLQNVFSGDGTLITYDILSLFPTAKLFPMSEYLSGRYVTSYPSRVMRSSAGSPLQFPQRPDSL